MASHHDMGALVKPALAKAHELGHEMEVQASHIATALYRCQRCGLEFTVGYPAVYEGKGQGGRRLEMLSAAALEARCPGRQAGS